jgi:hypothetical protein
VFNICYNFDSYHQQHVVTLLLLRHPIVKWAQRKDRVFIEVGLRDIVDEHISLTETTITFEGVSDSKKYGFNFELFDAIVTQ